MFGYKSIVHDELNLNSWQILISLYALWKIAEFKNTIRVSETRYLEHTFDKLRHFYHIREQIKEKDKYSFYVFERQDRDNLIRDFPSSIKK